MTNPTPATKQLADLKREEAQRRHRELEDQLATFQHNKNMEMAELNQLQMEERNFRDPTAEVDALAAQCRSQVKAVADAAVKAKSELDGAEVALQVTRRQTGIDTPNKLMDAEAQLAELQRQVASLTENIARIKVCELQIGKAKRATDAANERLVKARADNEAQLEGAKAEAETRRARLVAVRARIVELGDPLDERRKFENELKSLEREIRGY